MKYINDSEIKKKKKEKRNTSFVFKVVDIKNLPFVYLVALYAL